MRKSFYRVLGLFVLIGAMFAFEGAKEASAEVSVNINLGPPPIVVAEPPEVVMVPGSAVFFVPLPDIDVFFYNGYWWSPRGSHWYRSRAYNGPWGVVDKRYVPAHVFRSRGITENSMRRKSTSLTGNGRNKGSTTGKRGIREGMETITAVDTVIKRRPTGGSLVKK